MFYCRHKPNRSHSTISKNTLNNVIQWSECVCEMPHTTFLLLRNLLKQESMSMWDAYHEFNVIKCASSRLLRRHNTLVLVLMYIYFMNTVHSSVLSPNASNTNRLQCNYKTMRGCFGHEIRGNLNDMYLQLCHSSKSAHALHGKLISNRLRVTSPYQNNEM